jgi:DNA-directed RNA polymerase specialized sigma24 family protein
LNIEGGLGRSEEAERVALVASARRQLLLRAHRHRLRPEDLEDCLSQATLELVCLARTGARFAGTAHIANVLEQRFLSRIHDRRRAVSGRSPTQAVLERAYTLEILEHDGHAVADPRADVEELAMLRLELRRLPRLAQGLTVDQRLVLACQVALQMNGPEFCAAFGWTLARYSKTSQRARARLRQLSESEPEGPLSRRPSEEQTGTHL